jgi:hypothetical protein
MKVLFISNDPPYGTERVYNALRLARIATSSWTLVCAIRLFFRMCRLNEARGLFRGLRLPEQLIQRKFAAPSFAYREISPQPVRCSQSAKGRKHFPIEAAGHQGIERAPQAPVARRVP